MVNERPGNQVKKPRTPCSDSSAPRTGREPAHHCIERHEVEVNYTGQVSRLLWGMHEPVEPQCQFHAKILDHCRYLFKDARKDKINLTARLYGELGGVFNVFVTHPKIF